MAQNLVLTMKVLLSLCLLLFIKGHSSKIVRQDEMNDLFMKLFTNRLSRTENATINEVFELFHSAAILPRSRREYFVDFRTSLECMLCRGALSAVFDSIYKGYSEKFIALYLTTLCTALSIDTEEVCKGVINLNLPIFMYIIKNTPEANPNSYCGLILQDALDPYFCPIKDPRFEWIVDLPPKDDAPTPEPPITPLKIALITDVHINPTYKAGGVADCNEPICCRAGQKPRVSTDSRQNSIIGQLLNKGIVETEGGPAVNSDVIREVRKYTHKNKTKKTVSAKNSEPAGFWGDYRNCDTPIWAYDNAIEEIYDKHKDVDMIYYIGDTVDHGVWGTTYSLVSKMNRYAVNKIRAQFGKDVPVMMAIGNHDSHPVNQFAPPHITGENLNTTWLYKSLADKWGVYLDRQAKKTFCKQGDFAMVVRPGLKVISMNINVAYKFNWWIVYDPTEPKRHLDWLVSELLAAEQAGQQVHLLAHIPPGMHDLMYTWTREWNRIVNRFTDTIAAEFNGHTHLDEFKIFYNEDGEPIEVAWGGGGVITYSYCNLNYKIFYTNGKSYEPCKMENYVYNLTEANLTPHKKPNWFMLYDMQQTFRLTDLTAQSMNDLVYRMVTKDKPLLDLYSAFYTKLSNQSLCDDNCKLDDVCRTVITVLWDRERCEELRKLYDNS